MKDSKKLNGRKIKLGLLAFLVVLLIGALVYVIVISDTSVNTKDYRKEYNKAAWADKKIKIIALCTPNYRHIGGEGVEALKKYSAKHGYDFKLYEDKLLPDDVHVNFNKMQMLVEETKDKDYDFTILSDVDIEIKDWEMKMENIADSMPQDKVIGMPADADKCIMVNESLFLNPSTFSKFNAGFILARNTPEATEVFEEWVRAARNECEHLTHANAPNQRVFDNCVFPKYKDRIFELPYQLNGLGCSAGIRQFLGFNVKKTGSKKKVKKKARKRQL